jgi:hypothetical protein
MLAGVSARGGPFKVSGLTGAGADWPGHAVPLTAVAGEVRAALTWRVHANGLASADRWTERAAGSVRLVLAVLTIASERPAGDSLIEMTARA